MSALDLVWTSSLMDAAPVVHDVRRTSRRPARSYFDHVEVGLHPSEGQRVEVDTTPCGRIVYGTLIDPSVEAPQLGRYLDGRRIGVTMRTSFADAIHARRCRRCWPENVRGR